ncbi:hypothetical protein BCF46_0085 [Litoreibacter meonggei]|uniref:Uncharacterized protein n=1 Tax=Litoreibacter meonggei TaxID=1049199 RepID=A0A497WZD7_9RHOB|nr:hypothetical protein [Litoreibacter meonggei]RLJ59895.1 hypothetical protein BCF46_0085 [Litoreibacter meonggei]
MKGSHSRLSFREEHRYSNIAHVQGAMITDADLTEAGQIHQDRDEAQGAAFAGSGVPAVGGMVALGKEGEIRLQSGTVFAQGKQGHFRLGAFEKDTADLSQSFAAQVDLPDGPALTKGLVYVDVWERPIMAHEDNYLADAGLHGAETSYRTRTMVQLKSLPELGEISALPKALSAHPAFKTRGNATLLLQLANASTELDACDPCADLISVDKVLPNALVRFEVVSVERNKGGAIAAIRLAWSSENAEAVEPLDTRAALERDNAVYEYFSATTEAQLGYFHRSHVPARGAFTTDLRSDTPSDATLPKDTPELGYTHVRRWDGMVRVPLNTTTKPTGPSAASAEPSVSTSDITLATEFFTLTLNHADNEMVAGDYWLAELRRYAPEDAQALLNGAPLGRPQPPLGPIHHFCPIGISDGQTLEPFPDALRRRLSFPTLADLPASHIGYDADPDCDLLGQTDTVQEALDRVCEIDATHVAFTPSDAACDTLKNARSVDDALNALCAADDNKQLQLMMRTMMDWGVVCGLTAELGPDGIELSGGVALDRKGILHEVDRQTVKLQELDSGQLLHGDNVKDFEAYSKSNDEICVALAVNGTHQSVFLAPASLIYGVADLTLSDQVRLCLRGKGALTKSDMFQSLPEKPGWLEVLTKVHVCLRNSIRPVEKLELNKGEVVEGNALLSELINEYAKALKESGDPLWDAKKNELQEINEALQKDLPNSGITGTADQLNLVSMALRYAAIMKKDEEFRLDCLCDSVIPDCPALDTSEWTLIPLACVTLTNYTKGKIAASEVCMMCCRKQANTPRSHRFYLGDLVGDILAGVKELCAEEQLRAQASPAVRLREWLRDAGPAPWDPPYGTPLWPPKPTYGGHTNSTNSGQAVGGAASVLNEWQRGDNPDIISVRGKEISEATSVLKDEGFKLTDPAVVQSVKEIIALVPSGMPLLNRRPQAGDTVVILSDGKLATEFVVTEQASFFDRFRPKLGGLLGAGLLDLNLDDLTGPRGGDKGPKMTPGTVKVSPGGVIRGPIKDIVKEPIKDVIKPRIVPPKIVVAKDVNSILSANPGKPVVSVTSRRPTAPSPSAPKSAKGSGTIKGKRRATTPIKRRRSTKPKPKK